MAHNIHTVEGRRKLRIRVHEPYWGVPLHRGRSLGYRKIAADRGSWLARMRSDDTSKKYLYEPLGSDQETDYAGAKAKAEAWFKLKDEGVKTDEVVTVADACRAYVKKLEVAKRDDAAHDAKKRFERTVDDAGFGRQPLAKLRATKVREWRDGLGLKPGATNRTLVALKAALNYAVREKHAAASLTLELRAVEPQPGGKKRRSLYLDLKQRRALYKAATGPVRDLIEGVMLTGARAGELVNATVEQFEGRTKSMKFITGKQRTPDKDGSRQVSLSPAAVKLFKRLATGKAQTDRLFIRDDDGTPWAHSDWDELVREAAKAAGLPAEPHTGTCLYTLRHSFITEQLSKGMSTLTVARLVGTSVMMIEAHYGHLAEKAAQKQLAKVKML
jgi:integrase